ncbi:MAG TPA: phosphoglycerate dehydrogenase [Bacteroidota bacterium]|nr:phosphoglycerate dehydrogenase [Bacteroidota bacterium]
MTILITDSVDQQGLAVFNAAGFRTEYRPGVPHSEILQLVREAEALIVRSQTQVSADVLEAGKNLKVVGRAGAGVDNIDVDAATRRGIIVMNTPGGNTISTAEHTISMMLALARNIPQAHQSVRSGKWERSAFVGTEVHGKTLGVIGLGKVGAEVSRRAASLGMKVLAFDPAQSAEVAARVNAQQVGFRDLLRESDFITVHTPLIPETKGLIGKESLSFSKRGVRVINCARGGIVDEEALLRALEEGSVAGAALDVFEHEPPVNSKLVQHPRVVVTPHLGASTEEAQEKVAIQIAHQVVDALLGRGMAGSVNADAISAAMKVEVRPFLLLAEKLGRLLAQLKTGTLKSLTVSVGGEFLRDSLPALSAAVLKGAFERVLFEPVNYLNAPLIARERGIGVHLLQEGGHDIYGQLLSVQYQTDTETRRFSGTVFGEKDLRIVGIDGFRFEIKPYGHLLLYYNVDRPGMLASVSAILAKATINIGGLSLGRFEAGAKALTIISIDSPAPSDVVGQIALIDGVSDVKMIEL